MSPQRAEKLIAAGCGLGVLLLLAAQEKAWPWLVTPSARPAGRAASAAEPSPGAPSPGAPRPARPARPPLALSSVLPDAIPARWAGPLARAVREQRIGAGQAVTARGPLRLDPPAPDHLAADGLPPWAAGPLRPAADEAPPAAGPPRPLHPAVGTSLSETGPPRA